MLQSPSKHLSLSFLKQLAENRFISSSGIEYSEEEVKELLLVKEIKQSEEEFKRQIKPKNLSLIEHAESIRSFQDTVFQSLKLGDHKNLSEIISQDKTQCSKREADTIFHLPVIPTNDFISSPTTTRHQSSEPEVMNPVSTRRLKGDKMGFYKGHKIISRERVYSGQELRKERLAHEAMMKRIGDLLNGRSRYSKNSNR